MRKPHARLIQLKRYNINSLIKNLGDDCWQVAGYTIWRFNSIKNEHCQFAINHREPTTFYAVASFEEALSLIERSYLNILYAVELIEEGR